MLGPDSSSRGGTEHIHYAGAAKTAEQAAAFSGAMRVNIEQRKPVRVWCMLEPSAAAAVARASGEAARAGSKRRRDAFRYDGLYVVEPHQGDDGDAPPEGGAGEAGDASAANAVGTGVDGSEGARRGGPRERYVLVRLQGQPPLTHPASREPRRAKRPRDDSGGMAALPASRPTLIAELEARRPTMALMTGAQELCHGESTSLRDALRHLYAARERLLERLTPADRVTIAKRSLINQLRLRAAWFAAGPQEGEVSEAAQGTAAARSPLDAHPDALLLRR